MPKKGGKRRKRRTHASAAPKGAQIEGEEKVPRSFVFKNKKVSQYVQQLIADLRQVMAPYTALKLKERKKNSVKDYLSVAGTFGVTHFLVLSQTEAAVNLKVARTPQGPTLSFKVEQYTLCKSIVATQKKPYGPAAGVPVPAAGRAEQLRGRDGGAREADARDLPEHVPPHQRADHQAGRLPPGGALPLPEGGPNRGSAALFHSCCANRDQQEREAGGAGAAAEPEPPEGRQRVPHQRRRRRRGLGLRGGGRGEQGGAGPAVRGPRERAEPAELGAADGAGPAAAAAAAEGGEGAAEGDVMYHAHVTKTPQEAADLRRRQEEKAAAKKRRREEQEGNVARKRAAREEKLAERAGRRRAAGAAEGKDGGEAAEGEGKGDNSDDTEEEEEGQQSNNGGSDDDVIKDDNGGSSSTGDTPKKEQAEEGREEEEVDSEEEEFFN
eukprot:CAMPEP_0206364894 /NCGR_PEP_ID=MMETSP0294-20121207/2505_1 /ASSEMBLY_ACC=CAM_ASM_000327 /TAXON_ID=39354 /ORGANISM="Heterosigma akashiwo, Strain CCMP2393" /LENGTH=438 /DNA_ID=CAMNT_0053810609 /DNA_START=20 /DNA_END=1336 /DNA_ORIENTATION=+